METFSPLRRLVAEGLGTALLLAVVIGSGVMGERLAGGNVAIALLGNTLATGAALVVLIGIFGPISGAHFNPAVTLVAALRRDLPWRMALAYPGVQIVGGVVGVWVAHAMFGAPILQASTKLRDGGPQILSEIVATFGLVATILGTARFRPDGAPLAVGLYITAAYWFTASTSFANPAVTIARSLSDTFAGIAPSSAPAFILAQIIGALLAAGAFGWLLQGGNDVMTDPDFPITIFHNPACGTSRNTVAMVQAAGYEPEVVEYLQTGWTRGQLQDLAGRAGLTFRHLLREKGTLAEVLGLLADGVGEDRLLDAMVEHPILVNRPIVVTPKGVRLCRPSEVVLDLLDRKPERFTKEDGEVVKL